MHPHHQGDAKYEEKCFELKFLDLSVIQSWRFDVVATTVNVGLDFVGTLAHGDAKVA